MAKRRQPIENNEVSTSELKARCSAIVERVAGRRESIIVTRRGRRVARLVPLNAESQSLFGFARGAITVRGDLMASIDVDWEAQQ